MARVGRARGAGKGGVRISVKEGDGVEDEDANGIDEEGEGARARRMVGELVRLREMRMRTTLLGNQIFWAPLWWWIPFLPHWSLFIFFAASVHAAYEEKLLDPDLTQIIEAIDEFLLREKESTETKKEKFSENKHLRILDKCGNTIKLVGEKVSIFCEKNIKVGIEVLEVIGKCHWAAVGLVLVASVLEKMETKKRNKKECVMLLKSMNDLAKIVLELQPLPHETVKTQAKMKEAIHTIIHGAITCFTVLHASGSFFSGDHKEELEGIRRETEELRSVLHAHISVCNY
ncbi:hypothetical protein SUGI_0709300 [Cryptomeria japonica]|nr:hypothetical protein SUGI_0709300 [Cryptomeria japonica]